MNLKHLSDDFLLQETQRLAREEREILTTILHHLREIERRRLFSEKKFSSLFDYSTKELGYSEDQAARRISAMRLLRDLPEIEEKISSGALSLTHLGLAQSLFRREQRSGPIAFTKEKKIEILHKLESTPTRSAEKVLLSFSSSPYPLRQEKIKPTTVDQSEVRLTLSSSTLKKIEKLKGLRAHARPDLSIADLFDELCDLGLKKWDPSAPAAPRVTARKISVRRQVFQKANGECENCGSSHALEVDHIRPQAKGGASGTENLRLLCRACNQRAAIREFGLPKMESFLN